VGIRVKEYEVTPAQDNPEDLVRVPSGKVLPPCTIRVNNTGDEEYTFQCFRAPAGATHSAAQAVSEAATVAPGAIAHYQFPEPLSSGSVIRVMTNAPDGEMTFSLSATLV
jgi:hypothetical protein